MNANELCPSPHLSAADISGDTVVTIKSVAFSEVGEEKAKKGVVFFSEFQRGMVVNRTNIKRLIAHHGNETDEWVGKKITIYPSETDFKGETVPCLRVRQKE